VEKLGSLVRLTPRRLKPASSPGVGIWVTWTSQSRRSINFSIANWAAEFVVALMLSAISASIKSKLRVFSFSTYVLRFLTASVIFGGNSLILAGISDRCLIACIIRLEVA